MFDLTRRTAIVTGAGSPRGIGRAIAHALAARGAAIAVADIDSDGAQRVADELQAVGATARAYRLDVTDEAIVAAVFAQVVADFGALHILVNNAGVTQPIRVAAMTIDDWERVLRVNATGTFLCSREALKHLGDWGRIVSLSSVSAKRGGGVFGGAHYSAAKAAILGFSKALAREVSPQGVTVNCVAPGLILTDIRGGVESEAEQRRVSRDFPVPRVGTPADVAAAVCYLCSDEAGYITGEEIDINGGTHID